MLVLLFNGGRVEIVELDAKNPVDGSLIDVSDGLCLPWIGGDLNSKLLQKTPVTMNASESNEDRSGHVATFGRFQRLRQLRFAKRSLDLPTQTTLTAKSGS